MAEEGPICKDISFGNDTGKLSLFPDFVRWRQDDGHGTTVTLPFSEFVKVAFISVSRSYLLDIHTKDGKIHTFGDFISTDLAKVTDFLSHHGIQVVEEEVSLKGQTWGDLELHGHNLRMSADKKEIISFDLEDVSNVKVRNKNAVTLELVNKYDDDSMSDEKADRLFEVTFHIPDTNPVSGQALKNIVDSKKGMVYSEEKDAIVEFDNINVVNLKTELSSCKMFQKHFILEHKEKKSKMLYQRVVSIVVFHMSTPWVVIGLNPPLLRDQQMISDIMIQFEENDNEMDIKLRVNEALGKLEKSYRGKKNDVFVRVLGGLSGIAPSYLSGSRVGSSFRNRKGALYLLEDKMFFVPTPSTQILHDEILVMTIKKRSECSFDLAVELKTKDCLLFTAIKTESLDTVQDYIKSKGLGKLEKDKKGGNAE